MNRLFTISILLFGALHLYADTVELTAEEQAYVQKTKTIKMCVDPDWIPFERINEKGEHEGIAADLIALVSKRTGLKIELYPVKTWDESVAASKSGKCQIMSFLNQTPARDKWLIFTNPIFIDPNVFITREEHPFIANAKNLSNESIALPRNTMVEERIRKDYPNIRVIGTGSEEEAVNLVSNKKADMTMRSLIVAAYTIKKEGLFNLKISGQIPEYTNKLRIGVLKSEPILRDILDKGVQTITAQEMDQISNRHVLIKAQTGIDYVLVYKVAGGLSLLILLSIYWNRRLTKVNNKLSIAYTDIEKLQQETSKVLYQVETLLDNSSEGFLSFDESLGVNEGYSAECKRIFGVDIADKNVANLLITNDGEDRELFGKNLKRIFACNDDFKADTLISLLPKTFDINSLTLAAKYKKLENGNIMIVLTDVTEELALNEKIAAEQNRLRFVVNVFRDKADVWRLIESFKSFLLSCETSGDVAIKLHTFKGLFAQFDFYNLTKALHKAEDGIQNSNTINTVVANSLKTALNADVATLSEILQYELFTSKETIEVDKKEFEKLIFEAGGLSQDEMTKRLEALLMKPFRTLLEAYPRYTQKMAQRLEKIISPFEIEGGDFAVDSEIYEPFTRTLVHVFRNIVVHAIEEPSVRETMGKDVAAKISCSVKFGNNIITITISDDGRGIDIQKLIQKAEKIGLCIPDNPLMLVFAERLSSVDFASELSGRGEGLAALKVELDKLGGDAEVTSRINEGSSFVFKIPLKSFD